MVFYKSLLRRKCRNKMAVLFYLFLFWSEITSSFLIPLNFYWLNYLPFSQLPYTISIQLECVGLDFLLEWFQYHCQILSFFLGIHFLFCFKLDMACWIFIASCNLIVKVSYWSLVSTSVKSLVVNIMYLLYIVVDWVGIFSCHLVGLYLQYIYHFLIQLGGGFDLGIVSSSPVNLTLMISHKNIT